MAHRQAALPRHLLEQHIAIEIGAENFLGASYLPGREPTTDRPRLLRLLNNGTRIQKRDPKIAFLPRAYQPSAAAVSEGARLRRCLLLAVHATVGTRP